MQGLSISTRPSPCDHANVPVCGSSLPLMTDRVQQAPLHVHLRELAPCGALSVPPHHISPTPTILTSLTLLVAIKILCQTAFHVSIALSFMFPTSHPSVHGNLHYLAFLQRVDDARIILFTVPTDPKISDSTFLTLVLTPRLPILVPSCFTALFP
jgi:hypothetical protein